MPRGRVARIGNKLYDLGTNNKTFIEVAHQLKLKGIKNFYFMLEINDVSLLKVDPFAQDKFGHTTLSRDQIARIINECTINPWYYLREIVRLPDQGSSTPIRYKANRGNIAQAYLSLKSYDSWLNLPRQIGKTMSIIALDTWMFSFGTMDSETLYLNKSSDDCKKNLQRFKDIIDILPEYLRFKSVIEDDGKVIKGTDNATKLSHPITHNTIRTTIKATSKDAAMKLGRGLTVPHILSDEAEFTDYIDIIIYNSYMAFKTAHDNAIRNHAFTCRAFCSTPGDLDSPSGQASQRLLDNTVRFTEEMYDWDDEKIGEYCLKQNEKWNFIIYIEFSWKEVGKTKEWFEESCRAIQDRTTIRRELLLQRIHGSTLSPFEPEDLEYIISMKHDPIDEMWINEFYKFDIYKQLDSRMPYLVGVDCSTGTGSDNNAITILDPYKIEPVAEFESKYIGETAYEALLISLIQDHLPRAVLVIERNSVGDAIVDHLLHSPIASNLYYDKNKDLMKDNMKEYETVEESLLAHNAKIKTFYGVYTSTESRDTMFSILSRHVNEYKEKFITRNIIRDIAGLVRLKSGKIAAVDPNHDDSVMSYLMALYVRYHGNNLPLFGIFIGAKDEELTNSGLKRPEEIDPTKVSQELINDVIKRNSLEARQDEYSNMLKAAIMKSQKEDYVRHKKGLIGNTVFDTTAEVLMNDYESYGVQTAGNIQSKDMDFFDEVNNIGRYDNMNRTNLVNSGFDPDNPWFQ